jgi:hypothetical protein
MKSWLNGTKSGARSAPQLPQEACYQLRSLIETYERAIAGGAPRPGSDAEIARLRDRLENSPADLWWSDVVQAELILIEMLPPETIAARLRSWRRRFREVAGEGRYALYEASAPIIDAAGVSAEVLRADLMECVRGVYYFYSVYGLAARSRSDVTKQTVSVAFVILLIESIVAIILSAARPAFWPASIPWWPTSFHAPRTIVIYLFLASACAVLGSVVSVQRRLQDPAVDVDPTYRYVQMKADRLSVAFVSPFFGAIFGLVAYALLLSGLVSGGAIIPAFSGGVPNAAKDIALTLLYAFVAGFSEQLVPDALNRIAAKALPFGAASSAVALTGSANGDKSKQSVPIGSKTDETNK